MFISTLNNANLKIKMNDSSLNYTSTLEFINILKTVREIQPHHSSPTDSFFIDIISPQNTIAIILRRDSYKHDEYWIFLKQNSIYIGRVNTRHNLLENQPEKYPY